MPNWVIHRVSFEGHPLSIREMISLIDDVSKIDFNKIVPESDSLRISDGSWYVFHDKLHFKTAWSTPHSTLSNLSKYFPDVTFKVEYANEDILGGGSGVYSIKNGNFMYSRKISFMESCEIWGMKNEEIKERYPHIWRDIQIKKILYE